MRLIKQKIDQYCSPPVLSAGNTNHPHNNTIHSHSPPPADITPINPHSNGHHIFSPLTADRHLVALNYIKQEEEKYYG